MMTFPGAVGHQISVSSITNKQTMDSIQVNGIRAYGYVGYLPEERILGQWFEVDLTLWVDLTTAAESDEITDTLDYREAIAIVKEQITTAKFALVEKLVSAIANQLLSLEKVYQVRVQLSKPAAPIPDFGGRIILDITRSNP
jgi:7,8-dihydroneopterin aldolase/epimerase/oxygenase